MASTVDGRELRARRARGLAALALALLVDPAAARAERTQVFSIQGAEGGDARNRIHAELKKEKGVRRADFDLQKVELTVRLAEDLTDEAVISAVERAGLKAVVGPGRGAYLAHREYPPGADVVTLTRDGSAVGRLDKLRVPGKYTVFDVYADWCAPCKQVDARLREIVGARKDVAVRKLNVVDFDSPLARELSPGLEALPYMLVYSPSGKRTEVTGLDLVKLDKALSTR